MKPKDENSIIVLFLGKMFDEILSQVQQIFIDIITKVQKSAFNREFTTIFQEFGSG